MLKRYLEIKTEMAALKSEKEQIERDLYIENQTVLNEVEEGTTNFELGDYKLSVVKKLSFTVDQKIASTMDFGFMSKFEFDKKGYGKLTDAQKKSVDSALTYKNAKPSFSVKEMEE